MGRRGEGPIGVSIERRGYQQSQRGGPGDSITLVAGSDSIKWISIPCTEIKGQLPTVTLCSSFDLAQAPFICKIGATTSGFTKEHSHENHSQSETLIMSSKDQQASRLDRLVTLDLIGLFLP